MQDLLTNATHSGMQVKVAWHQISRRHPGIRSPGLAGMLTKGYFFNCPIVLLSFPLFQVKLSQLCTLSHNQK
jgi:hypothetical protein